MDATRGAFAEYRAGARTAEDLYRTMGEDIVVVDGATPVAIQCCEHCGSIKQWTDSDKEYLEGMSSMLSFMVRVVRT